MDSGRSCRASQGGGCLTAPGATASGLDLKGLSSWAARFPDPVLIADSRKRIVFLNQAATDLLGCPVDQAGEGPLCAEFLQVATAGEPHCFVERCLERREHVHGLPMRLRGRDGSWLALSVTASYLEDRDGNPIGCLAVLRHVRASVQASPVDLSANAALANAVTRFPTPLFLVNSELVVTYMNEALEELTGYARDEAVGKMTCAQLLSTNFCNTDECLLKQAMAAKLPICGVRQVIRDRQGREIPIHATTFMVVDAGGGVVGGVELNANMTPSRDVEQMLELLTEMSQDGILILDESGRVTRANAKMADITGRPQAELVGLDAGEILPSQHMENMRYLVLRLREEKDRPQQVRFLSTIPVASGGKREQGVFDTTMLVSRLGERVVTYVHLHDISERIAIESELRKANNFLTNIIQSSVDGIVVVDMKGNVLIFNEGAERILGYTAEEVKRERKSMRRIFSPELARELMRRMRSSEYGPPGKLNPIWLTFTRKDGQEVPVSFSAALVTEGGDEVASVGIFSDRRERVRLLRELEEAKRQVVQAEKIASLGRLSAGVAHEINNPLAGILIYAEALLKEIADHPRWREDLQEIINQTLRCKQIVTRLLEFSRQSLGQRVLFDLHEVIGRCVELLGRQSLFHDVRIVLDLDEDLPHIVGDPSELQQVCTNLMINAADAMRGKDALDRQLGRDLPVMINAADAMLGKCELTIRTRSAPESDQVILEFADTGPGIAPEIKEKIFEPFFTTKPLGSGTGLGLSVVYGIIQRHKGSIEVASPPGGGAIFTLKLPLQAPAEETETAEA
jgi:two-component system NtrC family sensor kinase